MRIIDIKNDNLIELLDGLSLLDDQDQERIIGMVDVLDAVDKKVKNEVFTDLPLKNLYLPSAYADDKI